MEALQLQGSCGEGGSVRVEGKGDDLDRAVQQRLLEVHLYS